MEHKGLLYHVLLSINFETVMCTRICNHCRKNDELQNYWTQMQ